MPSRITLLTGALLATALLASLTVAEAVRSVRGHRAVTEQVLADYATLGAQGSGGRLGAAIAPWFYQILNAVLETPTPSLDGLDRRLSPQPAALARQATWVGRLSPDSGTILAGDPAGTPPSQAMLDSLRAADDRLADGAYLGMVREADQFLIFSPLRPGTSPVAITVPDNVISKLFQELANEVILLPPALYSRDSLDRGLGIEVHEGARMIAQRGFRDSTRFIGHYAMGQMFGNFVVHVRIDEALAPALVPGGLPRSRLPMLAAVLGVTLLLGGAAVVQGQQERRLIRLREDVVAGASHELRTPLAQIRLFAETLRLGRVRSEDERDRALSVIEREARRLEHLVDNLLHTTRAERGGLHLAKEPLDLVALTRQIVEEFAPLAGKGDVHVEVVADAPAMASVDPAAWRQVMVNLLDNAVKYGGRGSSVHVRVAQHGGAVVTDVSDEGPGVPPPDRDRVWHRFWRGEAAQASGVTGSGLGLATVRDLVQLHGGTCMVVESRRAGATFRVELPA